MAHGGRNRNIPPPNKNNFAWLGKQAPPRKLGRNLAPAAGTTGKRKKAQGKRKKKEF
jgi:hypothetical protein